MTSAPKRSMNAREDFQCTRWLDTQAQKGRIRFCVRHPVRREGSSFFLQKADGRFCPDLLYQLPGHRGPAGADPGGRVQGRGSLGGSRRRSPDPPPVGKPAQDRCSFVMVTDKRWERIDAQLP
jgi:type III restriction enzyme